LYGQQDTTPPEERAKVIERNISLATGYALGLGQATTKGLLGDEVDPKEVRREMPGNLLTIGGFALRAFRLFQETAMGMKGFQEWLRSADLTLAEGEQLSVREAGQQTGIYQGPVRMARGNFGERAATEALASDGHVILSYKPNVMGTNQGGVDIVTLKNGVVHFIDNKALTRSGNISSVSSLTTNFAQNRATVVKEFTEFAQDISRPAAERAMFQQAVNDINSGRFVRAVTNANLAPDSKLLSGVTQNLQNQGIQFIDVMR
jgi:Holliday junction resolvase-like predicted endonuclease